MNFTNPDILTPIVEAATAKLLNSNYGVIAALVIMGVGNLIQGFFHVRSSSCFGKKIIELEVDSAENPKA